MHSISFTSSPAPHPRCNRQSSQEIHRLHLPQAIRQTQWNHANKSFRQASAFHWESPCDDLGEFMGMFPSFPSAWSFNLPERVGPAAQVWPGLGHLPPTLPQAESAAGKAAPCEGVPDPLQRPPIAELDQPSKCP